MFGVLGHPKMVFKLLVLLVILSILVIDNSAQRFNRFDIDNFDLYKYGLNKELILKRGDDDGKAPRCFGKGCKILKPKSVSKGENEYNINPNKLSSKRAWNQLDFLSVLRSMPREELETFILLPDEYEDRPEK